MSGFTQNQIEDEKGYCYHFIRKDLSLPQQIVQTAHAAIEMARKGHIPADAEHPSVILCGARDEAALQKILRRLQRLGVPHETFHEPDIGHQLTAIATAPIHGEDRQLFKHYQLLHEHEIAQEGGVL